EDLSVKIEVAEHIRWGEPVVVTVTVTAKQGVSDLGVALTSYPPVFIEDRGKWIEEGIKVSVDVKAHQPLVLVHRVRPPKEGEFQLIAEAYAPILGYVFDSVRIYVGREGGVVNPTPKALPGTPALVPTAPPEWRLTPFPTSTPWPTPFPTPTSPVPEHTPTPTQPPSLISPVVPPAPAASP
ncbi:MAG: hypothetical protein NZ572_02700, partial [Thermoflexus sp.]|nr:hypothetical protein [Thermoflexus sp.]